MFVFSTTAAEGFGIALAEAMAVGLPIVASDVPACREVLDGGSCADLVPPQNDAALAWSILALLEDPSRARDLGSLAAERALREYDVEACVAQYYG